VAGQFDFSKYQGKVVNVSGNIDMAELLAISDLLITDYSSCMFDFAITGKPMIFYIPDEEEYANEMRGFYFPMAEEIPGRLVTTKNELLEEVMTWKSTNQICKSEKYELFKEKFTSLEDRKASEKIINTIIKEKGE
jgi:CDP-glycerol glycerophosphotransferase